MLITICQLPNDEGAFEDSWRKLADHVIGTSADIVLLPEMPFGPWLAASPEPDSQKWQDSVFRHEQWCQKLPELGQVSVVATRPVIDNDVPQNRGFVFEAGNVVDVHTKVYLPREEYYWEANWYQPGHGDFDVFTVGGVPSGMMICTDMWFMQNARAIGKRGAELLFVPRATPANSLDNWLAGARVLAMISGCYVFSSNLCAPHAPDADLGGQGHAIDPEGKVLGITSAESPFFTVEVDPALARAAKSTYPRYVEGD